MKSPAGTVTPRSLIGGAPAIIKEKRSIETARILG
jgi:hypothetical protein